MDGRRRAATTPRRDPDLAGVARRSPDRAGGGLLIVITCGLFVAESILARRIVPGTNERETAFAAPGLRTHDPGASNCQACGSLICQEFGGARFGDRYARFFP